MVCTRSERLRLRPDWVIGDFGCGEALLGAVLPSHVIGLDHVAVNESVTACDLSSTPLEDASLDVAVFSLSLMGCSQNRPQARFRSTRRRRIWRKIPGISSCSFTQIVLTPKERASSSSNRSAILRRCSTVSSS